MAKTERDYLLGFIAHHQSKGRAYLGAILVTDVRGVPREFRHSEPLRPNPMQRTLYGDSLEASLGSDVLAPALYDALSLKPDVLLIDRESRALFGDYLHRRRPAVLLGLDSPDTAFRDVLSGDGDLLAPQEYELKGTQGQLVYAYIDEGGSGDTAARVLEAAQKRMNLVTPLNRIRQVLAEVAAADQWRATS